MQFIDLAEQRRRIRTSIDERIAAVLDHGQFILGPEVAELEARLAEFSGAGHCVGCGSGTAALHLPLMAWEVGRGHAVFVPAFSFFATAEVVALVGAIPVMVDIDPATFTMDSNALEKAIDAIRERDPSIYPIPEAAKKNRLVPRAVVTVDLFGQSCDYERILPICRRHDLLTLEDAAQAFGAGYGPRKTCGLGCDAAATSFYPAKPLGCYGEGGAVFTDDDELAARLRSLLNHGMGNRTYEHVRIGLNERLDSLQAAVLLAKLEVFEEELEARAEISAMYGRLLSGIPGLEIPRITDGCRSSWALYCIRVEASKRDALAAYLKEKDVPTNIYYHLPMHMQPAFRELNYAPEDMPSALSCSARLLALPFHAYLEEKDARFVSETIAEFMRK